MLSGLLRSNSLGKQARCARRLRKTRALLFILPICLALFFLHDPEPDFVVTEHLLEVSEQALRLHHEAIVIDLHIDSLIWPRDLRGVAQGGQVDFERIRAGGLDVASFTNPTRYFGVAGLKAFHDLWPPDTWFSPWARLRYQFARLDGFARNSNGAIQKTSNPVEIRRNHEQGLLSAFHGIEGAHALGTNLERVRLLSELQVVFVAPVHLSDNVYGGSSSPIGRGQGLSELGYELIRAMNRESILLDLAHASEATFADAINETALPPIVSHAGSRGVYDTWRNLSDAQIRAVADRGGVVGAMIAPPALNQASLDEYMLHLEHIVRIGGEDVVAIGTDFDGYVVPSIDVSLLSQITERMIRAGWSEARIKKALGENVLRVLGQRLEQP